MATSVFSRGVWVLVRDKGRISRGVRARYSKNYIINLKIQFPHSTLKKMNKSPLLKEHSLYFIRFTAKFSIKRLVTAEYIAAVKYLIALIL